MNLDLKNIPALIAPLTQKFKRYGLFVFVLIVLGVYGFLIIQISLLSKTEPSQSTIDEQLQVTKRPRIDENAAKKMKQLEDNSSEVRTLFNEARKNPFQE